MNLKHFDQDEFACRCGHCDRGFHDMDPKLLTRLDKAREIAGVPFIITSAIRCPAHNRSVGGAKSSSHLQGKAVDISAPDTGQRARIADALIRAGLGGRMGIHPDFIHVDLDPVKQRPCLWLYRT